MNSCNPCSWQAFPNDESTALDASEWVQPGIYGGLDWWLVTKLHPSYLEIFIFVVGVWTCPGHCGLFWLISRTDLGQICKDIWGHCIRLAHQCHIISRSIRAKIILSGWFLTYLHGSTSNQLIFTSSSVAWVITSWKTYCCLPRWFHSWPELLVLASRKDSRLFDVQAAPCPCKIGVLAPRKDIWDPGHVGDMFMTSATKAATSCCWHSVSYFTVLASIVWSLIVYCNHFSPSLEPKFSRNRWQ